MSEPCLLCGEHSTEDHHFPYCRQRRSQKDVALLPVVPLCRKCHTKAHWGKPETVGRLMALAPRYWRREGLWEVYGPRYEIWVSRRRYIQGT